MKKKTKKAIGIGVACIFILSAIGLTWYYTAGPGSSVLPDQPPNPANFDLEWVDGVRTSGGGVFVGLDEREATVEEYRLPLGADSTDWNAWEQNAAVTDFSDVDASDFDDLANDGVTPYSRVILNVSCASTDIVDDDGDIAAGNEDIAYYWRFQEIYQGVMNTIKSYETPNAGAGLAFFNSDSLAVISFGTIAANVNFTIVTMLNWTQTYARYEPFWDFSQNAEARLAWTLTANATCAASDLSSLNGLTKTRPSTVTLKFESTAGLGATVPMLHRYEWGASPSDIVFNACIVQFNGVTV